MTILRDQLEIAGAEAADLVETYNALTGKAIKKFENRQIAERRVETAMLAAKDADGHTGVPKGTEPQVKTREEITAKADAKGITAPPAPDSEEPVFTPGSLADSLSKAAKTAKPITPRPKKEASAAPAKIAIYAVQATFTGTSKPQAGSVRNNVLLRIQQAPNSAATIEALDKHFDHPTRGYIQKLIEKAHLIVLDEKQYAAAKPVKQPKA